MTMESDRMEMNGLEGSQPPPPLPPPPPVPTGAAPPTDQARSRSRSRSKSRKKDRKKKSRSRSRKRSRRDRSRSRTKDRRRRRSRSRSKDRSRRDDRERRSDRDRAPKDLRSCYECGETGHISRDCPNKRSGGGGGGGHFDGECYECGERGHTAKWCRDNNGASGGGRKKRRSRSRSPSSSDSEQERRRRRKAKKKSTGNSWDVPPDPKALAQAAATMEITSVSSTQPELSTAAAILNRQGFTGIDPKMERAARRLYLGKIPQSTTDIDIREFFDRTLKGIEDRPHAHTVPPVKGVTIGHQPTRSYAFVEFNTLEDAEIGLLLDGIMFQDISITIRRPKDYMPIPGRPIRTYNVALTGDAKPDALVYVGNLPMELDDSDLKQLLETFGEIRNFNHPVGKKFAFFSYCNSDVVQTAIHGLSGLSLHGQALTCELANSPTGQTPHSGQMGMAHILGQAAPHNSLASMPGALGGLARAGLAPAAAPDASCVLVLHNMVTVEELNDPDEYADVYIDVKEECSKYGSVVSLVIPRTSDHALVDEVGKIFVEFSNPEGAKNGASYISGRKFASRTIMTDFLAVALYRQMQGMAAPFNP